MPQANGIDRGIKAEITVRLLVAVAVAVVMRGCLISMIRCLIPVIAGGPGRTGIFLSMLEASRCTVVIPMACRVNGVLICLAGMLLCGACGIIVVIGVMGIFCGVVAVMSL